MRSGLAVLGAALIAAGAAGAWPWRAATAAPVAPAPSRGGGGGPAPVALTGTVGAAAGATAGEPAVEPCPAPYDSIPVLRRGRDALGRLAWWHADGSITVSVVQAVRDAGQVLDLPVVVHLTPRR